MTLKKSLTRILALDSFRVAIEEELKETLKVLNMVQN